MKEMLLSYIKSNVAPLLIEFISGEDLKDAIVLPASIDAKELNGHYDELEFLPPKWFNEILRKHDNKILVIDKIDTISKEEQLKFLELLKYRKISTFELPENCVIILTANKIKKDNINEKILSLVARI